MMQEVIPRVQSLATHSAKVLTLVNGRVGEEGNKIGCVCPFVCLFPLLTYEMCVSFDVDFLMPKGVKGSPYSITERRVLELIPVLDSQPAGDVSHKPGGRLPLLSAMPAVTPTTVKRAATSFAAW